MHFVGVHWSCLTIATSAELVGRIANDPEVLAAIERQPKLCEGACEHQTHPCWARWRGRLCAPGTEAHMDRLQNACDTIYNRWVRTADEINDNGGQAWVEAILLDDAVLPF